jgi:four helix bundle protein
MGRAREVRSPQDLRVWQVAMDLAVECYRLSRRFPRDELLALTSQLRRAASSIPANIAEGYGRESRTEYIRFLRIAQGSLRELETHLILAHRVGYLAHEEGEVARELSDHVSRLLRRLLQALKP